MSPLSDAEAGFTYCLLWVSVNEVKIELSFCDVLMMGKSVER